MVDTGAKPNIIKKRNIHPDSKIDTTESLRLVGITDGIIATLGTSIISYLDYNIKFHLVDDDFPISQEGILGMDFLRDAKNIDFEEQIIRWQGVNIPFSDRETIKIPARTRAVLPIKVCNSETTEGYVPRLNFGKHIYAGEALTITRNGKAYIGIINTNDEEREIVVPNIRLQEVEYPIAEPSIATPTPEIAQVINKGPNSESRDDKRARVTPITETQAETDPRDRQITSLLRLTHLNKEEAEHVQTLIAEHGDLFRLPNDKLECTDVLSHRIPTTNDLPIHTKQYRFPPIHKEEISKQVQELLENNVVKPSTSPYISPL